MKDYLTYKFCDTSEFISTFDEIPLWSASFGLLLFKHLELRPHITVLDLGSGTGFPLLELASRLGNSCTLYGIDPWVNANLRAKQKVEAYGLTNVTLIEASADIIPLEDGTIDLIVSNLGVNNFDSPPTVFKESSRVLKPGGKLVLTTNVEGHWREFYDVFYSTLNQLAMEQHIAALKQEEKHRGSIESLSRLFTSCGFKICRVEEESFKMNFVDGTAFLNHHFVKLGWMSSWINLFPKDKWQAIFSTLEENLNKYSKENKGLSLTVPMVYMEGEKGDGV